MKHLVFKNSGEIDLRALSTFGCSVKESDNPIGFFGTGLKYAAAVLLRTGHKIVINSGLTSYRLELLKDSIRGKEFEFVALDGKPLGFTTELGKQWKVWMAYRELYCNAKDEEGGEVLMADEEPIPVIGTTSIIVTGSEAESVHLSRNLYILEEPADFKLGTLEVISRPSQSLFYRGIRVMDYDSPALFTYNETGPLELSEDRTVKNSYLAMLGIGRAIAKYGDTKFLERVLVAKDCVEATLNLNWSDAASVDFFPTIAKLQRVNAMGINPSAIRAWIARGNGFITPKKIQPTNVQSAMIEKAIAFCSKAGFPVNEYPIIIAESIGDSGNLAMADLNGKQIILSKHLLEEYGTKGVASALIEEYLHLRHNFQDCSRALQNHLFGKIISLIEEINGEPL